MTDKGSGQPVIHFSQRHALNCLHGHISPPTGPTSPENALVGQPVEVMIDTVHHHLPLQPRAIESASGRGAPGAATARRARFPRRRSAARRVDRRTGVDHTPGDEPLRSARRALLPEPVTRQPRAFDQRLELRPHARGCTSFEPAHEAKPQSAPAITRSRGRPRRRSWRYAAAAGSGARPARSCGR